MTFHCCHPETSYRGNNHQLPPWITSGIRLNGAALIEAGVQLPDLFPEQVILLHVVQAV